MSNGLPTKEVGAVTDMAGIDEPAQTAVDQHPRSEQLRDLFQLLSPADLAALIGVDERTLAVWRAQKRGPDFVKLGRAVFYRQTDVNAWIELNVSPTDRVASCWRRL
jgi:predicted DNA-binding transcriptional regulator AlpA